MDQEIEEIVVCEEIEAEKPEGTLEMKSLKISNKAEAKLTFYEVMDKQEDLWNQTIKRFLD